MFEQIMTILSNFGADETVFYQFGIFFVIFILLKSILWNKLQFVIETRENKTVKLEKNAHEKFQKSEQLYAEYSNKVKKAQAIHQENLAKSNSRVLELQTKDLKKTEDSVDLEVEEKKKELKKEIETTKGKTFSTITEISNKIVKKMTG